MAHGCHRRRRLAAAARLTALALLAPVAGAVTASAAAEPAPATAPDARPLPEPPMAEDIASLPPIPLRREIARAEGRISDLTKARDAELAELAAAVVEAQVRAETAERDPGDGTPSTGNLDAAASAPAGTEALLDPDTRAANRSVIQRHYAERLAQARRRLARLLARQAVIDPEAPDQQRLREAATAGMTTP